MAVAVAQAPQHMRALEKANQVRLQRADCKRWLHAEGRRGVALQRALATLEDTPAYMESCTLAVFLCSLPRVGITLTRLILSRLTYPLSESKPLGSLTQRQRDELAAALTARLGK